MEIRPTRSSDLSAKLQGVIADLEARVDKTPAKPIAVATRDEYVSTAEKMKADKAFNDEVERKLNPFADLAFKIHRTITGTRAVFQSYGNERITYADRALVAYDDEQTRIVNEAAENLRKQAEAEDEQRRKDEAAELEARNEPERAKEVLAEPTRPVHVEVAKNTPKVGGLGFKERWIGQCEDEDALMKGVTRPDIYREIAAWLRSEFGPKAKKLADEIDRKAETFPAIPASIFVSTDAAKKALDTKITANANATNGKIRWPGVSVTPEKKTTTRR